MDTFKYSVLSSFFAISLLATVLTAPSHHVRHKRSPQTTDNNTAAFNPWAMFGGSFAGSSAQAGSFGGGSGGGSGSFAGSSAQAASFGGGSGNGGNGSGGFANSAAQAQSISYGPFSGSIAASEANAGSQSFSGIPAFLQRFFGR